MSEPEQPELGLEAAREHLARKGYLRTSLPPAAPGWMRLCLHAVVIAVAASAIAAWAAVAAVGESVAVVLPVAVGLLPFVLAAVIAAVAAAGPLARAGLRVGLAPAAVAGVLGVAAGAAIVLLLALATGSNGPSPPALLVPWLAGAGLAIEVTWAARTATLRQVSLEAVATPRPRTLWIALSIVAVVAIVVALPRLIVGNEAGAPPAPSFPPVKGRLAVVAVDGLGREDLEAVAAGDVEWGGIAAWGWAPLRGPLPALPAVLWSTVATGVGPRRHGITVLDEVRLFGSERGVPLTEPLRSTILALWRPLELARVVARPALERSAATVWEMASRAGVPVTVGGWWGSWPVRRLLGEVASERAWLSGSTAEDAVTAGLAPAVERAWSGGADAAAASDRLALAVAAAAAQAPSPHLVTLWLPGLDLVRRANPESSALALAERSRPHVATLLQLLGSLEAGGFEVWMVAAPWDGGTPFAAVSSAPRGEHASLDPRALAPTWLDQMGLPVPLGGRAPRRDLTGRSEPVLEAVSYGPPPPPLAAPPRSALEVQREVLRSLGYLQ